MKRVLLGLLVVAFFIIQYSLVAVGQQVALPDELTLAAVWNEDCSRLYLTGNCDPAEGNVTITHQVVGQAPAVPCESNGTYQHFQIRVFAGDPGSVWTSTQGQQQASDRVPRCHNRSGGCLRPTAVPRDRGPSESSLPTDDALILTVLAVIFAVKRRCKNRY